MHLTWILLSDFAKNFCHSISSFVRIHQILQDFRKGHLEHCQGSQCSSSAFIVYGVLKDIEVFDKAGDDVSGLGEPLMEAIKKEFQLQKIHN